MSSSNPTYEEQADKLDALLEERSNKYGASMTEKQIDSRQRKLGPMIRKFADGTGRLKYAQIEKAIIKAYPAR